MYISICLYASVCMCVYVCLLVLCILYMYVSMYICMYVCMVKILNSYQTPFKSSQSGGFNTLEESNCGCTFIFVAVYG